jgi:hypothetical protein
MWDMSPCTLAGLLLNVNWLSLIDRFPECSLCSASVDNCYSHTKQGALWFSCSREALEEIREVEAWGLVRLRSWVAWSKLERGWVWWLMPIILAPWKFEIGRTVLSDQPEQGVHKIPSQPMAGCGGTYLSSQICRGNINRRISVQVGPCTKWDLISKINNAKRAGRVTEVVKHLPSKYKTLSSTPGTNK